MASNGYIIDHFVYLLILFSNMCQILPVEYSDVTKVKNKGGYIRNATCCLNGTSSTLSQSYNRSMLNDAWLFDYFHPVNTRKARETDEIERIDEVHRSINYKLVFQLIGVYLAVHKYFEGDRRYIHDVDVIREFFRGFPLPPFMHPKVQKICERGFDYCVLEIFKSSQKSKYLNKVIETKFSHVPDWKKYVTMSKTQPVYFPFASYLEYFAYKTSATYYMCWFTMMKHPKLAYFMDKQNCLVFLNAVGLGVIQDYREDDKPFQCAMILFCPDACYGRKVMGNVYNPAFIDIDKGNPCRKFKNKTCIFKHEDNRDLFGLVWNVFNVTCSCMGRGRGYKYNAQLQKCVDINECEENVYKCRYGKICRNVIGGYACVCRKGFKFNIAAQMCETPDETRTRTLREMERRKRNGAKIPDICVMLSLTIIIHVMTRVWNYHAYVVV